MLQKMVHTWEKCSNSTKSIAIPFLLYVLEYKFLFDIKVKYNDEALAN